MSQEVISSAASRIGNRRSGMARRAAIASTLGSMLEWTDFTVYGALSATVFPKLFFSSLSASTGILAAFATFGVGFLARPLGGLIFGALGDRYGRKNILLYTLSLMGGASVLIGCLPTYASIGVLAPLALVSLRFIQGLALGGEATGAQLMTMEHAPPDRRGLFGALINLGNSASAACANGGLFALYAIFGAVNFERWGWRVPFLFSFVLVGLGLYIRRRVSETPAFEKMREDQAVVSQDSVRKRSVLQVLKEQPGTVLRLIVIWCSPAACFHVINVFTLTYVTVTLKLSGQTAMLCLAGANILAMGFIVGGGILSDRIGRRPTMLIASIMTLAAVLAYFALLDTRDWTFIFAGITFFVCAMQIQSGVQPAMFAEPFKTSVRYSGSAISYTGANLLAAGPAPFISAWLQNLAGGRTWAITSYLAAIVIVSMIAIARSPETRGVDLNR